MLTKRVKFSIVLVFFSGANTNSFDGFSTRAPGAQPFGSPGSVRGVSDRFRGSPKNRPDRVPMR